MLALFLKNESLVSPVQVSSVNAGPTASPLVTEAATCFGERTGVDDEPEDPWAESLDPWATNRVTSGGRGLDAFERPGGGGCRDQARGEKGKGGGGKGNGGRGRDLGRSQETSAQGDPWASGTGVDPWSTPTAIRANEKNRNVQGAKEEEAKSVWNQWTEEKKPALNAEKLLEASRAAVAARRAKEAKKSEEAAAATATSADGEAEDAFGAAPEARAAFPVSMPAALAAIGSSMARLVAGDAFAVQDLMMAVKGAPARAHALAIVSSAARSLLQGRREEATTLLNLEELIVEPVSGEAALLHALGQLAQQCGAPGAPLLLRALLAILTKIDEKSYAVRSAAASATEAILRASDSFAFEALLPTLLAALDAKRSPGLKLHALKLLGICWHGQGETVVAQRLPQLLPAVTALLVDTSLDVRTAASEVVEVLLTFSGNSDLNKHLEEIRVCAGGSKDVTKCVRLLAEAVFVQRVEAPALAVVMPVLTKALKGRNARTQRQACVVAENMGKLLPSAADVQPFVPQLLPLLQRIGEEAADPDVRNVASRARGFFARVADADTATVVRVELRTTLATAATAVDASGSAGSGDVVTPCPAPVRDVVLDYVVVLCIGLGRCGVRDEAFWMTVLAPHLEPLFGIGRLRTLMRSLCTIVRCLSTSPQDGDGVDNDEANDEGDSNSGGEFEIEGGGGGTPLCECTFTLACGAATLLKDATLRLRRGRVYGLIGGNDSGKSSLLKAIHERRVAGFPPVGRLVSSLVEHGVGDSAPACNQTPPEFLLADPVITALDLSSQHVFSTLKSLGFAEGGRLRQPIGELSGGWRMKLALARAMLQAADLLLLDEPTGHLDAEHVTWLVSYIRDLREEKLRHVTTLVVSHDAAFLDRICTDVIHVHAHKLKSHRGNFSNFLARVPGADLGMSSTLDGVTVGQEGASPLAAFVLPEPGPLEGVRSRGKRFLFLEGVTFRYPTADGSMGPAVRDATVECSLMSRVAIVGPNGAGKSTLASLLVGELAPDTGRAWRHPNLRVAFVAQHTFHHLERHWDLTATEYILWRFEGDEDREALEFRAEEEERSEPKVYRDDDGTLVTCGCDDPRALHPERVLDRRQRGRLGFEYEVQWRLRNEGSASSTLSPTWVAREHLASMGCLGMAKREDERQAAQRALAGRPLTTPGVEAHLRGFGLEPEEASHRRLGALSNGQRARAVLGAATWLAPHLLVLDEPSNYIDRPALVALAAGLQVFGGGVVVISHNLALLQEVCSERWVATNGSVSIQSSPSKTHGAVRETTEVSAAVDAAKATAVSMAKEAKERKKQKRLKEIRRKKGEVVSDDEDEWWDDLVKKVNKKMDSS
eukprot:TRINITY_DN17474_c6_g1_i1.p1 TRINITY_DN17474_c6_g1~~TRINITY_DN17474_c6_g1_i1.p1  ORF type:complete len:1446 (-),score=336.39 TRINITY_DN17474_c6_g1_i1:39-4058(-)